MTHRERQLLRYIEGYIGEHDGVAPSIREMAAAVALTGISGVVRMVTSLERQGVIVRDRNRTRGLRLVSVAPDLSGVTDAALLGEAARRGLVRPS